MAIQIAEHLLITMWDTWTPGDENIAAYDQWCEIRS